MTAAEKKYKSETIVYTAVTVLMFIGVGLCLAGLLLPNWYNKKYKIGIVEVDAEIGLFQDRICTGDSCENFWLSDSDYERDDNAMMPKFHAIRGLELAGIINAGMGLLSLIFLWASRKRGQCQRNVHQGQFFAHSLIGAFLCVTGALVLSSEASRGDIGYASILTGIGSACLFIAACFSCLICRHDPSYGTLENPISPAFRNA